jgi:glycosyltransferase involved in cell wall biosynthesis
VKLLFLTDNFPPEVNAPATRTYEHCVEWVKQGVEVTVITCAPNFPQGKVYAGYRNKLWQEEDMDGIRVIRVWSYITANKGFLKRTLDYISYAKMAFFAGLFVKTDIIIATSPQFFTAVSGWFLSIFKRKPWIMEVRDLWPESIRAVSALQQSRFLDWMEKLELHLYRHASKVVVVTDSFKKNIVARGIPSDKIHVIKNGVHPNAFQVGSKDPHLVQRLGLKHKTVVGYIGTHGMAHSLSFIMRALAKAPDRFHFLFLGDGAEKENIKKIRDQLDLQNVTMLDPVPKNEIKEYIRLTDIALVPLRKSDTFKTVIPSKIFENAAMEKPILLGVEGEAKGIIEQYGAGLCFEPENEEDFLRQLERLDGEVYKKCQAGCRELVKDFDRKILAEKMLDVITSMPPP